MVEPQFTQRGGKAYALAEMYDLLDFLYGRVFQNKLCQGTKRHLFAMIHGMRFRQCGKAVMNRMRRCQASAFKPNAAQVGIGLNDIFYGRGANLFFHGHFGALAVCQKRFIAKLCQRRRRQRGFGTGAIIPIAALASASLKESGQRIAHTSYEQAGGGFCNHGTVYDYNIGIALHVRSLFGHAVRRINDGNGTARRVGGCDCGHNGHWCFRLYADAFDGIKNFATAYANQYVAATLRKLGRYTIDFSLTAFPLENFKGNGAIKAALNGFTESFLARCTDQYKGFLAERKDILRQTRQFSFALYILTGAQ